MDREVQHSTEFTGVVLCPEVLNIMMERGFFISEAIGAYPISCR
jgi:hypothetical protein